MEPQGKSRVSAKTVWVVGLNVSALVVVLLVLYRIRQLLILLTVAAFLAMALNPAVRLVQRLRVRRGIAVAVVFTFTIVVFGLAVVSFVPVFVEQGQNLVQAAPELVEQLRNNSVAQSLDQKFGLIDRARAAVQDHLSAVAGSIFGVVKGFFRGLFGFGTVVVVTLFMLVFGGDVFDGAVALLDPVSGRSVRHVATRAQEKVGRYVIGAIVVASIGGTITGISLVILGVPYFVPLAVAMAILGIIPYAGPTLGGVLVVGTTFAAAGVSEGLVMLAVFLAYQVTENNLLQPFVQRRTIRMNPLVIILVLLVGTELAGVLGAVLALPVAGTAQVVLEEWVLERGSGYRSDGEEPG